MQHTKLAFLEHESFTSTTPCLQAVRRRISLRMCDISREPLALYTPPSSLYQFSLL